MSLQVYTHNPTEVLAIEVAKPWRRVEAAVPFARKVTAGDGRTVAFFLVSNPGRVETERAYPGDWIVKDESGYTAMGKDEFQYKYGDLTAADEPPAEVL